MSIEPAFCPDPCEDNCQSRVGVWTNCTAESAAPIQLSDLAIAKQSHQYLDNGAESHAKALDQSDDHDATAPPFAPRIAHSD